MNNVFKLAVAAALLLLATQSPAQTDDEDFRMSALEALISAPPERALPIVEKVLAGNHSTDLKERALFLLSQMETPESQARLLTFANDSQGELPIVYKSKDHAPETKDRLSYCISVHPVFCPHLNCGGDRCPSS